MPFCLVSTEFSHVFFQLFVTVLFYGVSLLLVVYLVCIIMARGSISHPASIAVYLSFIRLESLNGAQRFVILLIQHFLEYKQRIRLEFIILM